MENPLAPIDVAQHLPFIDRHLIRTPPAVRRALWLVAEGQLETDGEPTPVRARCLAGHVDHPDAPEWIGSGGEAGRTSVVLNELEERGVLVRYRGRGRRPHLWSFRPRLEHWQGCHWGGAVGEVSDTLCDCFCRAAADLVARFPGQSVFEFRKRAQFRLLSRDHLQPPGLFLVETRDKIKSRATRFSPPGLFPVETRDNAAAEMPAGGGPSLLSENSENSPLGEEEESYALLVGLLEHHARPGDRVQPGTEPDRNLLAIAQMLPLDRVRALRRHMDNVWARPGGEVRVPSGARDLRQVAEAYLPRRAAAL